MSTKQLNTRIQHKYDKKENFDKATFIPLKGELVIYEPNNGQSKDEAPMFKVGDGKTQIGNLPFAVSDSKAELPEVNTSNNGNFLQVVDGKWTAVAVDTFDGEVEE